MVALFTQTHDSKLNYVGVVGHAPLQSPRGSNSSGNPI